VVAQDTRLEKSTLQRYQGIMNVAPSPLGMIQKAKSLE